jgi:hypothetical protein
VGALAIGPKQCTVNKVPESAIEDKNAYRVTREVLCKEAHRHKLLV